MKPGPKKNGLSHTEMRVMAANKRSELSRLMRDWRPAYIDLVIAEARRIATLHHLPVEEAQPTPPPSPTQAGNSRLETPAPTPAPAAAS